MLLKFEWLLLNKTICKINVITQSEKKEHCGSEIIEQIKKN